jgi:hypothetical protein
MLQRPGRGDWELASRYVTARSRVTPRVGRVNRGRVLGLRDCRRTPRAARAAEAGRCRRHTGRRAAGDVRALSGQYARLRPFRVLPGRLLYRVGARAAEVTTCWTPLP